MPDRESHAAAAGGGTVTRVSKPLSVMVPIPWSLSPRSAALRYFLAVLTVLLIAWPLYEAGDRISDDNEMLLYLGSGIFGALYLGRGPARLASLLCVFILHAARIHPGFQPGAQGLQYFISFAFFLLVTDQIARLADKGRMQAWQSQKREQAGQILHQFSRECSLLGQPAQLEALLAARLPQEPELAQGLREQCELAKERLLHQERQRQAEVLQATQKLQSALILSLSHDLQTPVSSIMGSIDTLRLSDHRLAPEDREALLQLASEQALRLKKLIQNILNLSKLEGGALSLNWSWISLNELLGGVADGLPGPSRQRVRLTCADESPELKGDFTLLSQVLANLLDNALKFSPADRSVSLAAWTEEGTACICVEDRGFGVVAADAERIFDKFYRGATPVSIPGSGLGLNICRGLVELHKGTITYEPGKGGGSRFIPRLPLHQRLHDAA